MVVGVIDEVIRDGVTMAGVELLEECLGCFLLLEAELLDETISLNLTKPAHLTQVKVRGDGLDGIELIGADGCLPRCPIRGMDGDINPVIPDP